jgi:hypothetical protein
MTDKFKDIIFTAVAFTLAGLFWLNLIRGIGEAAIH